MKSFLYTPLYFILISLILGCASGNNRNNAQTAASAPMEKGKIISKVTCKKDNNISYALYLPRNYNAALKFPLIITFDPHGNGTLPLEKYKDLADKYGYILMGSNDSKNGQDMNSTEAIIDALFSETTGRYSINLNRIYVMGFSGGARIASMIGLYQGGVAGIIGCGAGFPSTDQNARFKPDYISIVGTADFNMNELINLDKQLEEAKFIHASIYFNGKHAWPPVEIMDNAFIWMEFCSMRKGETQRNDSTIHNFIHFQEKIIAQDKSTGDALAEYNHLINLIRFIDGLVPTEVFQKTLADLVNSSSYKNQQKQSLVMIGKEMKEQQELNENFFSKDINWWKKKIAGYDLRIRKGKDSTDVRMCNRLKSYLSLISYMNYSRVVSSHDTLASDHAMAIYEIVDPENALATKANIGK